MDVISVIRNKLEKAGLLPLRTQAELSEKLLRDRLDNLLPRLMDECDVDMWLITAYENNEDPVMKTMLTWDMRTARRLSAILLCRNPETGAIDRLTWGIPFAKMEEFYTPIKVGNETLAEGVSRMIEKYRPRAVEINTKGEYGGFCDGLSASLYADLQKMPPEHAALLRPSERLSTRWLETMTDGELKVMEVLVEVTEDIIKAAYSRDVITPGVTTTEDVEWFMRHVMAECQLDFWFGPDIDLQRKGVDDYGFGGVIEAGDLVHCDIGVYLKYLPVLTDKQWMAYVLREGETEAPAGVHALFAQGNRFQDISCEGYLAGRTGNAVFHDGVDKAKAEGLTPSLYCH